MGREPGWQGGMTSQVSFTMDRWGSWQGGLVEGGRYPEAPRLARPWKPFWTGPACLAHLIFTPSLWPCHFQFRFPGGQSPNPPSFPSAGPLLRMVHLPRRMLCLPFHSFTFFFKMEVQRIHCKIHKFQVHDSLNFYKCMCPYQTENILSAPEGSLEPLLVNILSSPRIINSLISNCVLVSPGFEPHVNRIVQRGFYVRLLLLTLSVRTPWSWVSWWFARFYCSVLFHCIIVWVIHNLFTLSAATGHLG